MKHRREHREVTSGRASKEASRRFGGALRREVGDLEVRLEEAQLRSSAFEEAGLHGEAAKVLEESREMVEGFHRRLNEALARAAVEREAEYVLASADEAWAVLGDEDELTAGGVLSRIPAGVGAAVASVAVLAMALVTLRPATERGPARQTDLAALSDQAVVVDLAPSAGPSTAEIISTLSPWELAVLAEVDDDGLEPVAALLGKRRQLLDLLAQPNAVSGAVLAELEAVALALREEGIDVAALAAAERRAAEAEAEAQQPEQPEQPEQPTAPDEPTQEPGQEPSEPQGEPSGEPGDQPSEDEDVIGGFGGDEPEDEPTDGSQPDGSQPDGGQPDGSQPDGGEQPSGSGEGTDGKDSGSEAQTSEEPGGSADGDSGSEGDTSLLP